MLSFDEYAKLDGTALAELIRRRDVSAAEVREVALSAITRFNPRLNAVLEVLSMRAPPTWLRCGPMRRSAVCRF